MMSGVPPAAATGNAEMDGWLIEQGAEVQLFKLMEQVPQSVRFCQVQKVMAKPDISRPIAYLSTVFSQKCRELQTTGQPRAGPAARCAPYPSARPAAPPPCVMRASNRHEQESLQSLARPLQGAARFGAVSPAIGSAPDWVRAAWGLQNRPGKFLAYLLSQIDHRHHEPFKMLPPKQQWSIGLSLVLVPQAWPDPSRFLEEIMTSLQTFSAAQPRPLEAVPDAATNYAVIHIGESLGAEVLAANSLHEYLRKLGLRTTIKIVEVHSVGFSNHNASIHEELSKKLAGFQYQRTSSLMALTTLVSQRVEVWKGAQAHVVVIVTVPPKIEKMITDLTPFPEEDVLPATIYFLEQLFPCIQLPSTLNVLVYEQEKEDTYHADYLNAIFGAGTVYHGRQWGLPIGPWRLRSFPPHGTLSTAPLAVNPAVIERCSRSLELGKVEGNAVIPSPDELDDLINAYIFEEDRTAMMTAHENLTRCSPNNFFLDRQLLFALHGFDGWRLQEFCDQGLPCHILLHPTTGEPRSESDPNAERCGKRRYCRTCTALYGHLQNTPFGTILLHSLLECIPRAPDQSQQTFQDFEARVRGIHRPWSAVPCHT